MARKERRAVGKMVDNSKTLEQQWDELTDEQRKLYVITHPSEESAIMYSAGATNQNDNGANADAI